MKLTIICIVSGVCALVAGALLATLALLSLGLINELAARARGEA